MPGVRRKVDSSNRDSDDERTPLFEADHLPSTSGSINSHGSGQDTIKRMRELGSLNLLSQKYESLDYDTCENSLYFEEHRMTTFTAIRNTNWKRWFVTFIIGILTALTACAIDICIEVISDLKFTLLKTWINDCIRRDCIILPYLGWVAMNATAVLAGAILVAYIAPVAAASGIPVIKCYLNGVKVPQVVRFKTLVAKAVGVVLSVVGGLAVGKEGPMIHCGSVIAAGISQGKSTTFRRDLNCFREFREDHEKRDFVSAGAAAGVAAAFGAPVGGVLFSLEEGASFWNQSLTWRIFFCSTISAFSLSVILSAFHGHAGELSFSGLVNFGEFDDVQWSIIELPIYIIMGACGGLLGAVFNHVNFKLTVFRIRYLHRRWIKVIEAVAVAIVTASVGFLMIDISTDCRPHRDDFYDNALQFNCSDGRYSALGEIWFQTPEASVRSLFHRPEGTWTALTLLAFFVVYFLLSCWTYGLSVSSGVFIPTLLVGAVWGRLLGIGVRNMFPTSTWVNPGKFALIGAAATLGGVVRMTLSLSVILIEATRNITFALPIMIALTVAKWVGDFFSEGLYDIHLQLAGVPFLGWEAPSRSSNISARQVMGYPVVTFRTVENVGRIIDVLASCPHNGFPVVDTAEEHSGEDHSFGRFRGIILRWQLIVLLQYKMFQSDSEGACHRRLRLSNFRDAYPRYPTIQQVHVSVHEREYSMDLQPFMNSASYTVSHNASLSRIFKLFRALGLRHLVVVNGSNMVVGIVTRKDLARYRMTNHYGRLGMEELHVSHG
ncbi:H(+)/Cl(-) exchange transporter 7 isoform X1 [Dermacentor silvarum]|uniref:H(+)/Cl(-) exchange transporter 7 isoform X1 n=1 Tax=Dermacentor silvarum TaxID=543639 RepID=UPI002100FE89|nr:H(+)/Cl(-) exchange transporter 7 isoform X1 [Dermacentor silvarum]